MVALVAAAVVWSGCEHTPHVRPASIVVACGDANFYVDHIRWRSWGSADARGTGIAHVNDCKPYCATGRFHTFAASVRLSKVVRCGGGRREFARIQWSGSQDGVETLPCAFLRLKP